VRLRAIGLAGLAGAVVLGAWEKADGSVASPAAPQGTAEAPTAALAGSRLLVRSPFWAAEFSIKPGLVLKRLRHQSLRLDLLSSATPIFAVVSDDKVVTSQAFTVAAAEAHGAYARVGLAHRELGLGAEMTLRATDGPEILLGLRLVNRGERASTVRCVFPILMGLQPGSVSEDWHYFYPFKGGWAGEQPFDLAGAYGLSSGSLQHLSVFNPRLPVAVWASVRDATGAMKALLLRKTAPAGPQRIVYHTLPAEMRLPEIFDDRAGVSMAFSPLPRMLLVGGQWQLPEAAIGVGLGDWRVGLGCYSSWAHRSWWRHRPIPEWLRRCFNWLSLHDHESLARGRYATKADVTPADHVFQWAYWWKHADVDRLGRDPQPGRWYRETHGWYEYEDRWGGRDALAAEIARLHETGSRVVMYVQSRLVWKHSPLGLAHGPQWCAVLADGTLNTDWSAEETNMDCYDICPQVRGWQSFLASVAARLVREVGADGCYLDTAAEPLFCHSDAHGHAGEPSLGEAQMLRAVASALAAANPQAVLQVEDPCSDYLMQFFDCTWLKQFERYPPMSNYTRYFGAYPFYFLRFYFPELHYADWGDDSPEGKKRCFFNGIGVCAWPDSYTARTGRVLRENADAFGSLHPEPMVKTECENVFANRFPCVQKVLYTLYNVSQEELVGPVLRIAAPSWQGGVHYVELLTGDEVDFTRRGSEHLLQMRIAAGEVVCVAQLPRLLRARVRNGAVELRLPSAALAQVLVWTDPRTGAEVQRVVPPGTNHVELDIPSGVTQMQVRLLRGGYLADAITIPTGV